MKSATGRRFHIPLPEQLYLRLKNIAYRQQRPVTQLAKQAVECWLQEQEKMALHEEVAEYAAAVAGTEADFDETLEVATLECLHNFRRPRF